MKFCTKCGNQMAEDMVFCSKCGAKDGTMQETNFDQSETQYIPTQTLNTTINFRENNIEKPKLRTSMKVWMIIFFVLAWIFLMGSMADPSMIAGVCLFGILGAMFLILAKTPKDSAKLFTESEFFKKNQGVSKKVFVWVTLSLAFFLFGIIINSFPTTNVIEEKPVVTITNEEKKEEKPAKKEPEAPKEFTNECPISVSASMYDNVIGFPELKCNFKNKTNQEISAIQMYFLPKDVYGDEVNGIFAQNRLQSDTPISANGSNALVWQMLDQSVKSGDLYVYSVYFSDGTEWGDRNASISTIKKYALQINASY